jgi:predicted acyl esterase
MGANTWKHASSMAATHTDYLDLYLSDSRRGAYYSLRKQRQRNARAIRQTVDLADRKSSNNDYYPYPIIRDSLDRSNGLFFISEPLEQPLTITGSFEGILRASINKKDMDIGVVLYEVMPDGRYFHLSYFLGRASYAQDASQRKLLTPGRIETIPFTRTRMVSRQLSKGSRLLVVLNINKNAFAQINYGTGKDVSLETIDDAGEPLLIQWYTDSMIRIPVSR